MDFSAWPIVTAEITFLRNEEGGRVTAPLFNVVGRYMPHIVIQDRGVRNAIIDADGMGRELYQGVLFISGPENFKLGDTGKFQLLLTHFPGHPYSDVQPDATFTVREGAKIVAHGIVLGRVEPMAE